ncbi:uncharacterized protein BDV14DRAFT_175982 [Aspergillus stella-maris]|uniref:uncharacterized protein n=1 Tax=Aspergillus stella-maris TaxID=1810926 RepID=UPI003CCCD840
MISLDPSFVSRVDPASDKRNREEKGLERRPKEETMKKAPTSSFSRFLIWLSSNY